MTSNNFRIFNFCLWYMAIEIPATKDEDSFKSGFCSDFEFSSISSNITNNDYSQFPLLSNDAAGHFHAVNVQLIHESPFTLLFQQKECRHIALSIGKRDLFASAVERKYSLHSLPAIQTTDSFLFKFK